MKTLARSTDKRAFVRSELRGKEREWKVEYGVDEQRVDASREGAACPPTTLHRAFLRYPSTMQDRAP